MLSEFIQGFGYVFQGFGLLRLPGVRRYVFIPLLINLVLFAGGIWYAATRLEGLMDWIAGYLPAWLDWLTWLLWPVFILTALIVVFYGFTLAANLIGAPFNALLAQKLEARLRGRPPADGGGALAVIVEGFKAVGGELRKLGYLALWMIPLLILSLVPGLNLLAPPAWALLSAWMLAIEYADYPMGNHGMFFPDQRALLRRHRPLALGFGAGLMLLTSVPILNFLAMPVGVAGATALWVERLSKRD